MEPIFKEGDGVRVREVILIEEIRGQWGFIVSEGVNVLGQVTYWVFLPEVPRVSEGIQLSTRNLAWPILEKNLEFLK
jgi:hypothetical protein